MANTGQNKSLYLSSQMIEAGSGVRSLKDINRHQNMFSTTGWIFTTDLVGMARVGVMHFTFFGVLLRNYLVKSKKNQ